MPAYTGHTYGIRAGLAEAVKELTRAVRESDAEIAETYRPALAAAEAAYAAIRKADGAAASIMLARMDAEHEGEDRDDEDYLPCGCCAYCGCDCED